jgi:hypothetical protein
MRTPGTDFDLKALVQSESSTLGPMDGVFSSEISYHEMAETPVQQIDILEQLEANMKQLTELQSRMNFMMREIRYLMKV